MIQNLKDEINFRYRIVRYKKLMKDYICNRVEKNNVQIIHKTIDDITMKKY